MRYIVYVYDSTGTKLVSYTYDAWGNFTVNYHNGATSSSVAAKNPLRYRGYYYDTDMGLYYLQSRYYDSNTGRFINPDSSDVIAATPMGLTDKNLFAYCDNNPITRADDGGDWWHVLVGAAVGFAGGIIEQVINDDWSLNACIQTGISTIEGAATALVGPVAGALISATSGAVKSAVAGNDREQIVIDSIVSMGLSFVGSGTQLAAGRACAGEFVEKASKTQLKKIANSLGYVGRNFKEASSWSGKIMYEASKSFANKAWPWFLGTATSFFSNRIYSDLSLCQ